MKEADFGAMGLEVTQCLSTPRSSARVRVHEISHASKERMFNGKRVGSDQNEFRVGRQEWPDLVGYQMPDDEE